MTTIMPKGEGLRQAVKWLAEELKLSPNESKLKLVDEASLRFNLNPNEEEFLSQQYKKL
jgi:hypothetical protein